MSNQHPIIEAERELLAIFLCDARCCLLSSASALLRQDFLSEMCGEAFAVLRDAAQAGEDLPWGSLRARLSPNRDWSGWFALVADLASRTDEQHIAALVRDIKAASTMRSFAKLASRAIEESRNGAAGNAREFLEEIQGRIADLSVSLGGLDGAQKWESTAKAPIVPIASIEHLVNTQIEYSIRPLFPKASLVLLQGKPKSGKSVFTLYCAISIAIGEWQAGEFSIDKPSTVLLVEYEDSPVLVAKRTRSYLRGMGLEKFPDRLLFCDNPEIWIDSDRHKDLLVREIRDKEIGVVFIDTLSYIHRAKDENASADMKPIMANLRRVAKESGATIVCVHHTGKGSDDKAIQEKGRGSSVISAAADAYVDWGDRKKSDRTPVSFLSKLDGEFEFRIEYQKMTDGSVCLKVLDADNRKDADKRRSEILDAIKALTLENAGQHFPQTRVYDKVKLSESMIQRYIKILEADGLVSISVSRGAGSPRMIRAIVSDTNSCVGIVSE
jgi:hypothetical protein